MTKTEHEIIHNVSTSFTPAPYIPSDISEFQNTGERPPENTHSRQQRQTATTTIRILRTRCQPIAVTSSSFYAGVALERAATWSALPITTTTRRYDGRRRTDNAVAAAEAGRRGGERTKPGPAAVDWTTDWPIKVPDRHGDPFAVSNASGRQ